MKKTSEEWSKFHDCVILDPDGWDRKNFQYSWYKEKITWAEFNERSIRSTCVWKDDFKRGKDAPAVPMVKEESS